MAIVEQMELVRNRGDITADVGRLIEKYRSILTSNVPELDQNVAGKLILVEILHALKSIEKNFHS